MKLNPIDIAKTKLFVSILALLLTLGMSIVYISSIDRDYERFISLNTLGSNRSVSNYFPNDIPVIGLGDEMEWNIQVYNRMGNAEYIAVRVKILNSTQPMPDDKLHAPSPVMHVYEKRYVIAKDQTLTFPLQWRINMIERDADVYIIKQIIMNDEIIDLDVRSVEGKDFRIVLELWKFNLESKEFEFSWLDNSNELRSVWNQIWFSIKQ